MENELITQVTALFAILTSTGFWGHFWATKRNNKKADEKFREEFYELRDRVLYVEQTAVRESHVKKIVEDAMQTTNEGITQIIKRMDVLQEDITEIKINEAKREGAAEALANHNKGS